MECLNKENGLIYACFIFVSDAFITEIYKSVLAKHKHVIGIYTARHSSWVSLFIFLF